jgi:hypothetical protein
MAMSFNETEMHLIHAQMELAIANQRVVCNGVEVDQEEQNWDVVKHQYRILNDMLNIRRRIAKEIRTVILL